MSLGTRIEERLKELDKNQAWLCTQVEGLEIGTLNALVRRKSNKSAFASSIANALGVSLEWLLSGDDETPGPDKPKWHQNPGRSPDILREIGRKRREAEAAATGNVTPLEISDIKIPLISWVQAGNLAEVIDIYQAGQADDWVTPIHSKPGKSVFALRVEGDSMTGGSNGVDFPHGCVILVDPDRAPKSGDYVVAKDVTTQKATFKKLTTDGVSWFLRPLNPAYPTREIDDPALRVIGVVIEWQLGGKL